MIRFEAVSKRYPDGTVAVDDLTLEAPTGQITVLVGPSGCGKTTSLRMVNRMVTPTAGRVLLDGRDVATGSPIALRRRIGYVIQHAGLFPHRTVADNIATVPVLLGRRRREARAAALDLLDQVGLDRTLAERYPSQLSGGQQQRVGVARALAGDPPVLLMDEPFSAVDPVVRARLRAEFLDLQARLAKTIVLVTHDLDEAITLGDRVAVFRAGGHLAQVAPPQELLTAPADEFVASFVGGDRGYRALGFRPLHGLQLTAPATADADSTTADGATASQRPGEWLLQLDAERRPTGWRAPDGGDHPLGVTVPATGTLRAALDAALVSPARQAVVVDPDGRLDGVLRLADLATALAGPPAAARP